MTSVITICLKDFEQFTTFLKLFQSYFPLGVARQGRQKFLPNYETLKQYILALMVTPDIS